MKKIIVGIALLALCISQIPGKTIVYAQDPTPQEMLKSHAIKYGVNPDLIIRVAKCENNTFDPTLQSGLYYTKDHPEWGVKKGDRELSFGISQIHLPSHPSISYEQATDPQFSADFMARNISEGRGGMWSCF